MAAMMAPMAAPRDPAAALLGFVVVVALELVLAEGLEDPEEPVVVDPEPEPEPEPEPLPLDDPVELLGAPVRVDVSRDSCELRMPLSPGLPPAMAEVGTLVVWAPVAEDEVVEVELVPGEGGFAGEEGATGEEEAAGEEEEEEDGGGDDLSLSVKRN